MNLSWRSGLAWGRSTIREAVKALVSKGILEVRRGSGTYVISTYSLEDDPLGFARFQDRYQLALELFRGPSDDRAGDRRARCRVGDGGGTKKLNELCDEVEQLYREGKTI